MHNKIYVMIFFINLLSDRDEKFKKIRVVVLYFVEKMLKELKKWLKITNWKRSFSMCIVFKTHISCFRNWLG